MEYRVEVTQDTPRSRREYTVVDPDGEYISTHSSERQALRAAANARLRRPRSA